MPDDSITIDELTQECGIAYRTAKRRLRAAGVRPSFQDKRGMRYPRAAALAAIEQGEDGDSPGVQTSGRERLDLARATREELLLAKMQGDLMPVGDAVREWEAMIVNARTRLMAIPAMGDTPPDYRPILEGRIRDALIDLSEWKPPGQHEASSEPLTP